MTEARIVICGGGAGGLELAVGLAKTRRFKVTLVDPRATHLWKPLLHEVASGSLDVASHEVSYLALARWRGFVFAHGALEGIDRAAREVIVGAVHDENGSVLIPERRLAYDALVLSVGGVTNDFGIPGVRAYAYTLDTVHDAERIHARILKSCIQANYAPVKADPFHVAIVGGGATGVELAAELRSTARTLSAYGLDNLDPDAFLRLTIVNADARLLQQLPEQISDAVGAVLSRLGIAVRNSEQVVAVEPDGLMAKSGDRIRSDMTIWAAGVRGPPLLRRLGLETNRLDQIVVTETLQSTTDPDVFAIGDCAAIPWTGREGYVPPRAQAAHQEARHLLRVIPAFLRGEPLRPFRYNDLGSLLSLGERGGIGTLMGFIRGAGLEVDGFIASLLYRFLYRRHLAALFGWWTVALESLGHWMGSTTRPRVKLH
jgi:NADH dehydrogenase